MLKKESIIIVTGAAGFIGSCMVSYLNKQGYNNLILVDQFDDDEKELNLHQKNYLSRVERDDFFEWLDIENPEIEFVFHLGARTDTTEFDYDVFEKLNVRFSKDIWKYCSEKNLPAGRQCIPLIYASSAATYGGGELGYKDDHALVEKLKPLNPYGVSKNEFDKWALKQSSHPPFWAGLKFFNVFGPNEYHKSRMASVVFHAFNQIQSTGKVKLFKSHRPEFKDGEQLRDFIYVQDVVKVMFWIMKSIVNSEWSIYKNGIYNLGTGKARTFKDLVTAIFKSLNIQPQIEYIDTPADIRERYQYFTEADMNKLVQAGYKEKFYSLEEGVKDYVSNYLSGRNYY